ncbi:MAG: RloB family protein [Bacteroidales bacterium]
MAKYQRKPKGKTINPTFFVFCEGESEDAYVSFLKSHYRVPIEIISKIAGNRITHKYITNTLRSLPKDPKDKLLLLYDIDTPGMLEKLQGIKKAILLASNPCFELWYILHFVNQVAEITSHQCIEKFERIYKDYKKGSINGKLRDKLTENMEKAVANAKKLPLYRNPSTSIYLLINELDKV